MKLQQEIFFLFLNILKKISSETLGRQLKIYTSLHIYKNRKKNTQLPSPIDTGIKIKLRKCNMLKFF